MPVKRIVCLANSRKLNGRCVAGIEVADGRRLGWIRPVSAREHEEVSEGERRYGNGNEPGLLDVMDVSVLEHRPRDYQQENWLLDPSVNWQRAGRMAWADLPPFADQPEPLWINHDSTYNGMNDRIPIAEAARLRSSLRLILVDRLTLSVCRPGQAFGNSKRRVQGRFAFEGEQYHLWITDPQYEDEYLAKADGAYSIGESFVTVSLGEPHNGYCYKLIAAIIERDGAPHP